MTDKKPAVIWESSSLFVTVSGTDLQQILTEALNLSQKVPEILERIEDDQFRHAMRRKEERLLDRKYHQEAKVGKLFPPDECTDEIAPVKSLDSGRPRMPAVFVLVYLMVRGFLGSISDRSARKYLSDSKCLAILHDNYGYRVPGITTILENINVVSEETLTFMQKAQLELVLDEGLDDCSTVIVDSTSVNASSCWPTDSGLMVSLFERIFHRSQRLDKVGAPCFRAGWLPKWLEKLNRLDFAINHAAGKPGSKKKIRKGYRSFLRVAQKALSALIREYEAKMNEKNSMPLPPSGRRKRDEAFECLADDLSCIAQLLYSTEKRVMDGIVLPSVERVLSISDADAAFIKKGGREPVVGYKPQLVRSGNGFVTAILVPEGNASDSGQLLPALEKSLENTGVSPMKIITDDGYASRGNREVILRDKNVKLLSMGGSKGRKITPADEWDSEAHKNARNSRSAVESLMFVLKHMYAFGKLRRRGINAVRKELLEKILVYNFDRIVAKRRQAAAEKKAAA